MPSVELNLSLKKQLKMISKEQILKAHSQIRNEVFETPLVHSLELSKRSGANVYLKMEHLQNTGSFKLRGASFKIGSLSQQERSKTLVAASTGNHAAAFAHVSHNRKLKGVLFLPENVSPAKLRALESYEVEIRHYGSMCLQTEAKAAEYAQSVSGVLVHPYNDEQIITGQGTVGVEIEKQLPEVELVMAPIGGGGLISGLASYFAGSSVKVVGSQPENAAEMYHSINEGRIAAPSKLETISDATAGGIEDGSLTFDICREHLHGIDLCSEDQIKRAIYLMIKHHQTIIEPGAALSVASLMNSDKYAGKNVAIVLTGKKINTELLTDILNNYGDDN